MVTKHIVNDTSVETGYVEILCLSTDTKPLDVPVNSLAYELDTKDIYYFGGENWSKVGA